MKFHLHVPKLIEFALYSACDDIVKHGKQGLKVAMPRPLYYRCIMTFAEKYSTLLTIKKAYDAIRCGREPCYHHNSDVSITLYCCISLIDHISFEKVDSESDFEDYSSLFFALTVNADEDVDSVIECIHRFGTRCDHHGKHQLSMDVMTETLNRPYHTLCKVIRDVVMKYGAKFDKDAGQSYMIDYACSNGLLDEVKHLGDAIESTDIDTVNYVTASPSISKKLEALPRPYHQVRAIDFTIEFCRQLLELGIIERGTHYEIYDIPCMNVLQWLLDNDMLDHCFIVCEMAHNAATRGGVYVDMLHYMIEQRHLPMPRNVLLDVHFMRKKSVYDLSVFDYLLFHGADMNELLRDGEFYEAEMMLYFGALEVLPLCLRYWIDNGITHPHLNWAVLQACVSCLNRYQPQVLDTCLHMLKGDVHVCHHSVGVSLLHCAAKFFAERDEDIGADDSRIRILKFLLDHGANVNIVDVDGHTPLHIACTSSVSEAVSMLLDHGATVNARDGNDKTPLFAFIDNDEDSHDVEIVTVLLEHGANVHARNDRGQTPLHAACARASDDGDMVHVIKMLLQYCATTDMYVKDYDDCTPYDLTHNETVRQLLIEYGYGVN